MPDLSAVPPMPDGRSAAEHIRQVRAGARRIETPMPSGGRMVWHAWGEGPGKPPLLLFHGGSGSWIHWIRNVGPLAGRFAVFAADLPGLGESDPPPDILDIRTVAEATLAGVDSILAPDARCIVAGFSFGAMVGGHLAVLAPERIGRLVLVGPGGLLLPRAETDRMTKLEEDMPAEVLVAHARRNLLIQMIADPGRIDGVAVHQQILNSMRAVTRSRRMSNRGVLHDILDRIAVPVSAIWGELDSTAYPHMDARIALMAEHFPEADVHIAPGAGHWVAYEAPDFVNGRLLAL